MMMLSVCFHKNHICRNFSIPPVGVCLVGLTGNERADRLAKISSQALQTQNPVTYRKKPRHFSTPGTMETGRKKTVDTRHTLTHFGDLERAQQTTIFRLHTGCCGLSAHLKRTGISDTSLCECGQADQTSDHILQSSPKYAERHPLTWQHGADLVTKLWGSAEDPYWTAGFVVSNGLKV